MKMFLKIWIAASVVILGILVFNSVTKAALEAENRVKVVSLNGGPKIMKAGSGEWAGLETDASLDSGDRIKTAKSETVEIAFAQDLKNMIRIEGDSDLTIAKISPYQIELLNGEVMAHIKKLPAKSTFEIKTPAGVCGARGTGWLTGFDGIRMTVRVFEDKVFLRGIEKSGELMTKELIINQRRQTALERFERPSPSRIERIAPQDMQRWNGWRDTVRERAKEEKAKETKDARDVKRPIDREPVGGARSKNNGSKFYRLDQKERTKSAERAVDRIIEKRESKDLRKTESRPSSGDSVSRVDDTGQ